MTAGQLIDLLLNADENALVLMRNASAKDSYRNVEVVLAEGQTVVIVATGPAHS
jgi:hypothetical protein